MEYNTKVLMRLMPKGGWSCNGDVVTIHDDGIANGYTVPTQEEFAKALEVVAHNEPILEELARLDAKIPYFAEYDNTDPYLVKTIARKKELRAKLKSDKTS